MPSGALMRLAAVYFDIMIKEEYVDVEADELFVDFSAGHEVPEVLHGWKGHTAELKELRTLIRALPHAGQSRVDEWGRAIRACMKWELIGTEVAFCGATGSGKSTCLNALLAEALVPTHGFQACTSVPVAISYHSDDCIKAEIRFMSREELESNLTAILGDLHDEQGVFNPSSLAQETSMAWAEVKALYPHLHEMDPMQISSLTAKDLLSSDEYISTLLDRKKETFELKDLQAFARKVHRYLQPPEAMPRTGNTSQQRTRRALWPLVKKVDVYLKAPILSTGLNLIDLPGGGDSNKTRTRIADLFIDRADHLLISSTAVRAADDAVSRGEYASCLGRYMVTFVNYTRSYEQSVSPTFTLSVARIVAKIAKLSINKCKILHTVRRFTQDFLACIVTKCDDVSPEEIIPTLNLLEDPDMRALVAQDDAVSRDLSSVGGRILAALGHMSKLRRMQSEAQDHHGKRRRSDANDVSLKRPRTETEGGCLPRPSEDQGSIDFNMSSEQIKEEIFEYGEMVGKAQDGIQRLETALETVKRQQAIFCARKRNTRIREMLNQVFLEELREAKELNGATNAAVRAEDASGELAVFPVSARDYCRIKGIGGSTSVPSTFLNESDTGIPVLLDFLRTQANPKYQAGLRNLKHLVDALTTSVSRYIDNDVTDDGQEDLKKLMMGRWDSAFHLKTVKAKLSLYGVAFDELLAPRLKKVLLIVVEYRAADWQETFTRRLSASMSRAAKAAAHEAPQKLSDAISNLRWQTLNAICRRNGEYRHYNLNASLGEPFVRRMLNSWESTFKSKIFEQLKEDALDTIRIVLKDVELCVVPEHMQPIMLATKKQLQAAIDEAQDRLRGILKDDCLCGWVTEFSDKLYQGLKDVLMNGLETTLSDIQRLLEDRFEQLAEEIENIITAAWQLPRDNPEERATEQRVKDILTSLKDFAHALPIEETPTAYLEPESMWLRLGLTGVFDCDPWYGGQYFRVILAHVTTSQQERHRGEVTTLANSFGYVKFIDIESRKNLEAGYVFIPVFSAYRQLTPVSACELYQVSDTWDDKPGIRYAVLRIAITCIVFEPVYEWMQIAEPGGLVHQDPTFQVKQEVLDVDVETVLAPDLDVSTLPTWREQLPILQELHQLISRLYSAGLPRRAEWTRSIDRRVSSCIVAREACSLDIQVPKMAPSSNASWFLRRYGTICRLAVVFTDLTARFITLCGRTVTGAGKSTVLNALLEARVVPTHGYRACTSVPIRILFHARDNVAAKITFLHYPDFKREIEELLHDLCDEHGEFNAVTGPPERRAAWTKIKTVYPFLNERKPQEIASMQAETLLNSNPYITGLLQEHTRTINAPDFPTLLADLSPYLAPPETVTYGGNAEPQVGNAALWPLVSQVDIYWRSNLLSTGLVLVDLPGGGDANRARTRIAEEYMDKCDYLMIVSTAVRPGDETTSQDLMTKALGNRLRPGRYTANFLTFLVTKSDDIAVEEIIRSMGPNLPPHVKTLKDMKHSKDQNLNVAKWNLQAAQNKIHGYATTQGGNSPEALHAELTNAKQAQMYAGRMIRQTEYELQQLHIAMAAHCAKARSEHTREILVDNFRRELEDLEGLADGQPTTFTSEEDTGIPPLRRHLFNLASQKYQAGIEDLRRMLHDLTTSLSHYIENNTADDAHEKLKLAAAERWDATHRFRTPAAPVKVESGAAVTPSRRETRFDDLLAPRLKKVLANVNERKMEKWRRTSKEYLVTNCLVASALAAKVVPEIFSRAINELRWQTLNAVCRRDGAYRDHDLNNVLSQPFIDRILRALQGTFRTKIFEELRLDTLKGVEDVLEDVQDSVTDTPIMAVTQRQILTSVERLKDALELLIGQINENLQSKRVILSGQIVPYIQRVMSPAYMNALQERGRGSLARRRNLLHSFVKTRSEQLYAGLSDALEDGLEKIVADIRTLVARRFEQLAEEMQNVITMAWQSRRDNPDERAAEQRVKTILTVLGEFVNGLPRAGPAV
ncbi:hypothetical protein NM688_g5511 [Phlebia brevispora]|uniref:Uncharacterized protein n=1 Tax=Phlebia brevispora TaxID=194682 RepID=A0ACC1SUA9_9APHY|nr:hypothetical protein NM688_g5511 [Phlebia brevispora]